jgi:hypothetical protein
MPTEAAAGCRFVNVTPHNLDLVWEDGTLITVPPSGTVLRAKAEEDVVGRYGCAEIVRMRFVPLSEAETEKLSRLELDNPGALVIGSVIAAQAWPGRIVARLPIRAGDGSPRGKADKFQTF